VANGGGSGDTTGQEAEEDQEKNEEEGEGRAETGEAGGIGEAVDAAAAALGVGSGHDAGVSLGAWEREGLRPLLEVCFAPALLCAVVFQVVGGEKKRRDFRSAFYEPRRDCNVFLQVVHGRSITQRRSIPCASPRLVKPVGR